MSIDYKRMTYQELADILGITASGAANLAKAHNWPRYVSFDGKGRVSVPVETLTRRERAHKQAARETIEARKAEQLAARKASEEARREKARMNYREHAAAMTHPESAWRQKQFDF